MRNVLLLSSDPSRISSLRTVFSDLPDFVLSGVFGTLRELLSSLQKERADVIFIDSEVVLNQGVPLLLRAEGDCVPLLVVLAPDGSAAEQSYGVSGVIDYLAMPCGRDRISFCVSKLRKQLALCDAYAGRGALPAGYQRDFIFVKVNKRYVRLPLEDIAYAESVKDYVKIVCEKKSFLVYNTLTNFTASLPEGRFLRIHRSYTVAVDKIEWMDGNSMEIMGMRLPLTKKYLSESLLKVFR